MPTLCGLYLAGCLPVSAPPLLCHLRLFHLSFFMLHALCWETGWNLYCQRTHEPVTALYTVWSGSKLEVQLPPTYNIQCLSHLMSSIHLLPS